MSDQVVNRLMHYIAEAYQDKDEERLHKLRHDIECGIGEIEGFYVESQKHMKRKVFAYNETKLKLRNSHRRQPSDDKLKVLGWMDDVESGRSLRNK